MYAQPSKTSDPDDRILYLSSDDIRSIGLSIREILNALESMFLEKAAGRVEMPPKPGIHPSQTGFIHAMPAYIPAMHAAGVKWISAFPENSGTSYPQVAGLIIVNDPATGMATAIMDCAWITALRTAAASGLAARCMAPSDASVIGILGCGVQGRSHLAVFNELFPLKEAVVYDINAQAQDAYIEEMVAEHSLPIHAAASPRDAVASADVVISAGPITMPAHGALDATWLKPSAFASAVDFASYWAPATIDAFDRICTDDVRQFEAYRDRGYFKGFPQEIDALADLIASESSLGRTAGRTLACNLGIAAEDIVVAQLLLERAQKLERGTLLPR